MPSFGFDANGTYLIEFENIPIDDQFQIAFFNKKQYKSYFFKFFPPSICDMQNISKFNISANNNILKGSFSEKTVLYPFLLQCNADLKYLDLSVIASYHNPTTYLDNRMVKGINGQMFICILFFIISIIWLGNIAFCYKSLNGLNGCITAIILFFMFSHILRFCELQRLDKSDDSEILTNSRIVFSFFGATASCFFFLLGAEGYCILFNSLTLKRILTDFIVATAFSGCLYLTIYYNFTENFNMVIILDIISFILYGHELLEAMKRANVQVVALLLAASNAGTNQNTSSFLKNKQYIYFQRIFISILCIIIFFLLFNYISFLIPNWIVELLGDLVEISVLSIAAFIFRPKKSPLSSSSSGITNRLIDNDNEEAVNDIDTGIEDDEIQLSSIDNATEYLRNSPTPNQPLLQQNPSAESEKKVDGNNYVYL